MQVLAETIFDIAYLAIIFFTGFFLLKQAKSRPEIRLMGLMCLILGGGDAFHLLSRIFALWTSGIDSMAPLLGLGMLITSITMTVFYIFLYHIWRLHYTPVDKSRNFIGILLYILGIIRIFLCLLPQNKWFEADSPYSWGIYRNIPFILMGIIIIILFERESKAVRKNYQIDSFRFMGTAITLSFLFYIPVILWAGRYPIIGMLMIPKTCAYIWVALQCINSCHPLPEKNDQSTKSD
ncbi:hypothetical protein FACS1894172_02760 [Spirochaetia bacterium]|nr:hypothetical protein FACS1894164_19510 [Spirochaetia bacterium]GHU30148.1 hypothetical protein FACS1894172_02760 [Spirochaetia bacterium]